MNFLVYSLQTEEAGNQNWNEVVKIYYDALIDEGIQDYSWTEFEKDIVRTSQTNKVTNLR